MIDKYLDLFNEEPKLIYGFSYDSPIYQKLMKIAIERNSPLTNDEINEYFEDIESDYVDTK